MQTERIRCGGYWITIHRDGNERRRESEIIAPILEADEYDLMPLFRDGHEIRYVVDVGAYVGAFSLKVKSIWPLAKVVAFEPNPSLAALYRENLGGFNDVDLLEGAAVGPGHAKTVTLSGSGEDNAASFIVEVVDPLDRLHAARRTEQNDLGVAAVSIVDALNDFGLEEIDILKIDAEGAEAELLEALDYSGMLARTAWIRGEWHHNASLPRIEAVLARNHVYHLARGGPAWGSMIAHHKTREY